VLFKPFHAVWGQSNSANSLKSRSRHHPCQGNVEGSSPFARSKSRTKTASWRCTASWPFFFRVMHTTMRCDSHRLLHLGHGDHLAEAFPSCGSRHLGLFTLQLQQSEIAKRIWGVGGRAQRYWQTAQLRLRLPSAPRSTRSALNSWAPAETGDRDERDRVPELPACAVSGCFPPSQISRCQGIAESMSRPLCGKRVSYA